ncbi:MAG TPA: hypothetical protein VJR03_00370 [Nitrospira sp.]|nr:hypothetical protein [Nitrospira sp.]
MRDQPAFLRKAKEIFDVEERKGIFLGLRKTREKELKAKKRPVPGVLAIGHNSAAMGRRTEIA